MIHLNILKIIILLLDTVITNEYEVAQINNGIKRQKKANIKEMNLLYRSTRDGGSANDWD